MELGHPEEINIASVYQIVVNGNEPFAGRTYFKAFVDSLPVGSIAAMMLRSYSSTASDTAACIRSVFLEGLGMFVRNEGVMAMLGNDELQINHLGGETQTGIYVILPDETPIYDTLAGVLCGQLMGHYVRLAEDKYTGKLPCRLNICLEELGNIGKSLSVLPQLMSAGRSRNIRCQLVLQSLSQLDTIYGESQACTIRSNADVFVAFRTNHWQTLCELSDKCGEREVVRNNQVFHEKLITPSQLAAMETGQALVMISGRTKFISWLPDFTEMFNCKNWEAPMSTSERNNFLVSVFDFREYVKTYRKKQVEDMMKASKMLTSDDSVQSQKIVESDQKTHVASDDKKKDVLEVNVEETENKADAIKRKYTRALRYCVCQVLRVINAGMPLKGDKRLLLNYFIGGAISQKRPTKKQ